MADDNDERDQYDEETGLVIKKKKKTGGDTRIIELFAGPRERQDEGIRSGKVEDGGLPGLIHNMVAAEKTSSNRAPTDYGQVLQAAATQQYIATTKEANQKWERAGVKMNFKPGSGM